MYCKICKREIEKTENGTCPYCGGKEFANERQDELHNDFNTASPPPPKRINQTTYLVFAILTTVCCCVPLGIPAIVYASKIESAQARGDYYGAAESAKKVKLFCIIGAAVTVAVIVIYFLLVFFGIAAGFSSLSYSGYFY